MSNLSEVIRNYQESGFGNGIKEKVEYLSGAEGMKALIEIGSMSSPVLAVDGKIAMTGFTPDIEKIKKLIKKSK